MAEALAYKRSSRFSYLDLGEEQLPSESQKVSESVRHEDSRSHGGSVLKTKYAHRPDVFVGCNLFVHYPDPTSKRGWSMVSPDLFVAFGMPTRRPRPQRSFVVWRQEGRTPDFVLEIVSRKTRTKDVKEKPGIYAGLGVREYFLYDPDGVLRPELQGFALADGACRALPEAILPGGARGVRSEVLGLDLCVAGEERELRWREPSTGEFLRTYQEEVVARASAEDRAASAEAEVARLQAQLRQLRDASDDE